MDPDDLRGDCRRCAALCCLGLAFDRSERFAFAKPAGEPCPNLTRRHGCAIHAELEPGGFGGCAAYDCQGAGQRVTQEVFGGRSWRDDASLIVPMLDAFHTLRRVQELLVLLRAAACLPLSREQARRRRRWLQRLAPEGGWTAERLADLERSAGLTEACAFLRTLRAAASKRRLPLLKVG